MADDVIDIEEGMKRRQRRRRRRAKTGHDEKPTSRLFWIFIGAVTTVIAARVIERTWPRRVEQQPAPLPPAEGF